MPTSSRRDGPEEPADAAACRLGGGPGSRGGGGAPSPESAMSATLVTGASMSLVSMPTNVVTCASSGGVIASSQCALAMK